MTVSDSSKVDILWKKLAFGVTETSQATKDATNEAIPSPVPLYGHLVWSDSDKISVPAPTTSDSYVKVCRGAAAIKMVVDPTVTGRRTWIAVTDNAAAITDSNRLGDWIPPTFDPTYVIKVWVGDPTVTGSTTLNAITHEFYFDYVAGVLYFVNGLPASVVASASLYIEGYRYIGSKGGSGLPADIQEIIKNLVPAPPPKLSDKAIEWLNGEDTKFGGTIRLVSGATNMMNSITAGEPITQFVNPGSEISTKPIIDFQKGDSGVISAEIDGIQHGHIDLSPGVVTPLRNGHIELLSKKKWPDTFPYYNVISAKGYVPHTMGVGLHSLQLVHSQTGATPKKHCVFTPSVIPTVTNLIASVINAGEYVYSSGIPHYKNGASFRVNLTLGNLAAETYLDANIAEIQLVDQNNQRVQVPVSLNPGINDVPVILSKNHPQVNTYLDFNITNTQYAASATFWARSRNPYAESTLKAEGKTINVMNIIRGGTRSNWVVEDDIPVINMGDALSGNAVNGFRVPLDPTFPTGYTGWNNGFAVGQWDSTRNLMETEYLHEAVNVGGVLKWDRTNWSSAGYLPMGPDYSVVSNGVPLRKEIQYAAFAFKRKYISRFKINIVGTYENIFIHYPTETPNSRLFTMRDWAPPAGVPTNGVAVGKLISYDPETGINNPTAPARSGSYVCSLGTLNSSNSFDNLIIVIIELHEGQQVNFLSFSSVNTPDIQV